MAGLLTGLGGAFGILKASGAKDNLGASGGAVLAAVNQATNSTESDYAIKLDDVLANDAAGASVQLPDALIALGAQEALVTGDAGRLSMLAKKISSAPDGNPYFLDTTRQAVIGHAMAENVEAATEGSLLSPFFDTIDAVKLRSSDLLDWGPTAGWDDGHTFDQYNLGHSLSWDGWVGTTGFSATVAGMTPMFTGGESQPIPLSDATMNSLIDTPDASDMDGGGLGIYKPYVFSRLLTHHRLCDATATWTVISGHSSHTYFVNDDPGSCYLGTVGANGLLWES